MYTQLSLLLPHVHMIRWSGPTCCRPGPGGTSRGHRRRNRRRNMPSCTSRRTWAKRREARAAVGAVCVLGAGAAVVAEGVARVNRIDTQGTDQPLPHETLHIAKGSAVESTQYKRYRPILVIAKGSVESTHKRQGTDQPLPHETLPRSGRASLGGLTHRRGFQGSSP